MISRCCKKCEEYLKGLCIGTDDGTCFNIIEYAFVGGDCDYGDYNCESYKED